MSIIFDSKTVGDLDEKYTKIVYKCMIYKMWLMIKIVPLVDFNSVINLLFFILSFVSGKTIETKEV